MVRVTALMDNDASENKALVNEHGLSYLLEGPDFRILFDCGAGPHPWANAHRLGLCVGGLDAVVLSHSHYDHAAGFRDLLEQGLGGKILYTGPHFFEAKFAFDGLRYTDLSAGFGPEFLAENRVEHRVVEALAQPFPGLWLVGSFPRRHGFETIQERFVRQTAQGFVPDDFCDEICMAVDTPQGLAIFVGCSHPGILNMVEHVCAVLERPVMGVFGGTHLTEADEGRIEATIDALRAKGLRVLGLSHCSGQAAERCAARREGLRHCHLSVGDSIFLEAGG